MVRKSGLSAAAQNALSQMTGTCPRCDAPKPFLYKNNGSKGQLLCKVCSARFSPDESRFSSIKLRCPHCGNALVPKKERKHFILHKCVNPKCPYYLYNLKKVDKEDLKEDYGKNKYKLHYIYREFMMDFFSIDLNTLPKNASSLKFSKHNAHVMSLCLTLHVNLGLSLRKTSEAMGDLYNISISHQYCSFQGSDEPIFFGSVFHRLLDTTFYIPTVKK